MTQGKKENPSWINFGSNSSSPKMLRQAKQGNREKRILKRVFEAKENLDKFPIDFETCWMCWMDLTGEDLEKWRRLPYSKVGLHEEVCPLCAYPNWKGRIWYPFRFIRGYIGNPSARDGIKK